MANARSNCQQILASTTEYHAIGPFAANEFLDTLTIALSIETAGTVSLSAVLHPTPDASAATMAVGTQLIEQSDLELAAANGMHAHLAAQVTTHITLPIKAAPQTHPQWVHVAIENFNATKALDAIMTVTSEDIRPVLQGAAALAAPAPPPPPPPPLGYGQPGALANGAPIAP